ncbi:membrane protein [Microbacterium phage ChickenKing]|nr:membrane protein [Microbacterium phage ChickenKing]QNL31003.1 membrane protein [Microbacterium phage GaeCeo]
MNTPWEFLWVAFGWVFFALCVLGALILLFALLVGIARGVRQVLKPRGLPTPPELPTYLSEARVVADDIYKDEVVFQKEMADAFVRGARWGWGFFHRK